MPEMDKRCFWLIAFPLPLSLFSLPMQPSVKGGEAVFDRSSQQLSIQAGERAEIDWNTFSIENGELVRFIQPSNEALALNRVVGQEMSLILGKLEANGKVVLINPNGLIVGKEAMIDTGSFIASTLDLQRDFGGKLCFKGESQAKLTNVGSILARSGNLALIGADIDQQGSLEATKGSIALIGSNYRKEFECNFQQEGYSRITQSGRVRSTFDEGLGGRIHLSADGIYLYPASRIETSNQFSGGEILIGAGVQGKDPDFTNATLIWTEKGAQFFADAWDKGSGGNVVLFSDGWTDFEGLIFATGGKEGGNGGFAEVSGKELSYRGLADLRASAGETGTILLDPSNITVVAGAAAVPTAVPVNFMFCQNCLPVPACVPAPACLQGAIGGTITQNLPIVSSNLGIMTIAGQLALGNVVIDSSGGVAGPNGFISWAVDFTLATVPAYATANALVLNAVGNVTINAGNNVQNAGTGNLILATSGAVVTINAHFGSQNGLTQICAPNAAVTLNGNGQVGFHTPALASSDGSIDISCNSLTLNGNIGATGVQIGHGQIDATVDTATGVVNAANISVNVVNTININSQAGNGLAWIGHGSRNFANAVAGATNQNGNIFVTSQSGNINLNGGLQARIGHGSYSQTGAVFPPTFTGNITVTAGGAFPAFGNITLTTGVADTEALIGHGGIANPPYTVFQVNSTITLTCTGNLTQNPTALSDTGVGAAMNLLIGAGAAVNQPMVLTVGNDIILSAAGAGRLAYIGTGLPGGGGAYVGDIEVTAGRDILATSLPGQSRFIGAPMTSQTGGVFVGAARDIIFQIPGAGGGSTALRIVAGGNISVAAGRNIEFTNTNSASRSGIGTYNSPNITATARIRAAGHILARGGTATGPVTLGPGPTVAITPVSFNVDVRAGGDIQYGTPLSTGTGFIYLEADSLFAASDLWGYAGGLLTSIDTTPLPIPIVSTCAFQATAPNPINASSPAICPNGQGAFRYDPNVTALPIATHTIATTGNFTLHSAGLQEDGATLQNLIIEGPSTTINSISFLANPSAFDISGSVCSDGFNDITLNPPAGMVPGNIRIIASNDLIVNVAFGALGASSLTLGSDCNQSGAGTVFLLANVSTVTGPLSINAGAATPNAVPAPVCVACNIPCPYRMFASTASITQTVGTISSTSGAITLLAQDTINVNGAATAITSASGSISCEAGNFVNLNRNMTTGVTGTITIISDRTQNGIGNVVLNGNVLTSSGAIVINAGQLNGQCASQSCFTSPITGASLLQIGGQIRSTAGGAISLFAENDIQLITAIVPCVSTTGPVQCFAGDDIILAAGQSITSPSSMIFVAGHNLTLSAGASISATMGASLTIAVDNNFPNPPFNSMRPIGILTMGPGSSLTGTPLQLFTALQNFNVIDPTALLNSFIPSSQGYPGPMFQDTSIEQWCTFFSCPARIAGLGIPFTFFYKNCLQQATAEAMEIVDEFFVDLHPYNEFPGWVEHFWIEYRNWSVVESGKVGSGNVLSDEGFYLRRRHLNLINHPKSWTVWMAEGSKRELLLYP